MAMKVTSMTFQPVLRELSAAQKTLYDMFVGIAGYDLDAKINKFEVEDYIERHFEFKPTAEELDEFFRVGKTKTKDATNPDELTAIDYFVNIHAFPIVDELKCKLVSKIAPLKEDTQKEVKDWVERQNFVIDAVKRIGSYCMVDAEQTYIQYGIDSITIQLQSLHNKKAPLVMGTYQAYLKRTRRNVMLDVLGCKKQGIIFGTKVVRGAYYREENELALDHEVESPVFPNKAFVDNSYNDIMKFTIANMGPNSHLTVATHNEESVQKVLEQIDLKTEEIKKNNITISFAQLKGIGDRLTYGLSLKGFQTFKYLPFGPITNLIPYLFRRAEEASYIWLEGRKKLVEVKKEMIDHRRLHVKAGAIGAGIFTLCMLIQRFQL